VDDEKREQIKSPQYNHRNVKQSTGENAGDEHGKRQTNKAGGIAGNTGRKYIKQTTPR
jgi:hypothetical protein